MALVHHKRDESVVRFEGQCDAWFLSEVFGIMSGVTDLHTHRIPPCALSSPSFGNPGNSIEPAHIGDEYSDLDLGEF